MALTRVMKEKYMNKAGNVCPYCGSTNIEASIESNFDGLGASRDVTCIDCDKEWVDIYTLTEIAEI